MTTVDERVRSMLEESQIEQAEAGGLVELLTGLEERYVDAVPVPSRQLAALFGAEVARQGAEPLATPWRRRALAAGVVSLAAVVTTGLTAAANELPDPVQRWVSEFSERYLPFELPAPADDQVSRESSQGSHDDAGDLPPLDLDRGSRRDPAGAGDRHEDAATPPPAGSGGDRDVRSGGEEAAEEEAAEQESGYARSSADEPAGSEQEVAEGDEPVTSPAEETEEPAGSERLSESGDRAQAESEEEDPDEGKAQAQTVEEEGEEDDDG